MTIGIVLVSHVAELAQGIANLIQQVAPDVPLTLAGGTADGGVGTDAAKITQAVDDNPGDELMVFYDLGSAKMTLDLVAEMSTRAIYRYDTAFVESAYSAAALAQAGVGRLEIEAQLKPLRIK